MTNETQQGGQEVERWTAWPPNQDGDITPIAVVRATAYDALKAQLDAMTARAEHLAKYATHSWTCDAMILDENDATKLAGKPCSCGFAIDPAHLKDARSEP